MKAAATLCSVLALLVCTGTEAPAQTYPNKPIRILVPFPPGASDAVVRVLADRLSPVLGQPVLVENKPGAGGNIANDVAAKAPPDGHTLVVGLNGSLAVNPLIYASMPLDPAKDLAPISMLLSAPQVLVVNPKLPVQSVQELVAYAKKYPGKLSYGSIGSGSASHLTMERFRMEAGFDAVHVPYGGAVPALTDLIGGQIDMMVLIAGSSMPHVRAGKLRALAVTSLKPSQLVPGIPALAESGYPGFEVTAWMGLLTATGTPLETITRLSTEVNKILAEPAVKERFLAQGYEVVGSTPDAFSALIRAERAKWIPVVKATGAKAD